jgi:hypothetical protein
LGLFTLVHGGGGGGGGIPSPRSIVNFLISPDFHYKKISGSRRGVRVRNQRWVRNRIFFNKFTTKAIGIGTRRAADPM